MSDPAVDLINSWGQWAGLVSERLSKEPTPGGRAHSLAELLRDLVPVARFARCQFGDQTRTVGDADTGPLSPSAAGTQCVTGPRGKVLGVGFVDPLAGRGSLEIGLPVDTADETARTLEVVLGMAGAILSQQLQLEGLRREQQETADLVMAGEAAVGMVHAINNHLNSMILQAMAVQVRLSEPLRGELGNIRREGLQAANRLRQLQTVRERPLEQGEPADLNQAVTQALRRDVDLTLQADVQLAPSLPLVPAPRLSVYRLVRMILHVALESHRASRPLVIRTQESEGEVGLTVEVDGPSLDKDSVARMTDLQGVNGGLSELERTAAHCLARRLEGRLEVTNREGGVTLRMVWGTKDDQAVSEGVDP